MSNSKRSMTLEYDADTEKVLNDLKDFFGVKTKAEVIRRSLAVTRSTRKYVDDNDRTLSITEPETGDKIKLAL